MEEAFEHLPSLATGFPSEPFPATQSFKLTLGAGEESPFYSTASSELLGEGGLLEELLDWLQSLVQICVCVYVLI